MTWPRVLVDEDFHHGVIEALRLQGFTAFELTQAAYPYGASDRLQVERAATRAGGPWVLLSHNRRQRALWDLYVRAWRERGNETVSVLLLPQDVDEVRLQLRVRLLLDWYDAAPLPKPRTLIWNDAAQPLLRGERRGAYTEAEIRAAVS